VDLFDLVVKTFINENSHVVGQRTETDEIMQ